MLYVRDVPTARRGAPNFAPSVAHATEVTLGFLIGTAARIYLLLHRQYSDSV